ncbi:hypothetical protein [Nocardia sp. NRRL S-836]|uniref:hypothetical protein n=1 Tax=Nocardia sp. NRRL S-836 TaxID=1519492 RepID=UPI0006AECA19|nr:hypothetical protein [Nocardia sp. NRRL S-836]
MTNLRAALIAAATTAALTTFAASTSTAPGGPSEYPAPPTRPMVTPLVHKSHINPAQHRAGAVSAPGVMMPMTAAAWPTMSYLVRTARDTPLMRLTGAGALSLTWMIARVGPNCSLVLGDASGSTPAGVTLAQCSADVIGGARGAWTGSIRPADHPAIRHGDSHEPVGTCRW